MTYLIRKISYPKWRPCESKAPEDYDADAITSCIRTTNNTLSVWQTINPDLTSDENKELITAIASIQQSLDLMDLVVLEEAELTQAGIDLVEIPGESKIDAMNGHHRDLAGINYKKLGIVSQKIVNAVGQAGRYKRFTIAEVQDLFLSYYGDNYLDSPLSERVKDKIKSRLGNGVERKK